MCSLHQVFGVAARAANYEWGNSWRFLGWNPRREGFSGVLPQGPPSKALILSNQTDVCLLEISCNPRGSLHNLEVGNPSCIPLFASQVFTDRCLLLFTTSNVFSLFGMSHFTHYPVKNQVFCKMHS